MLGTVGSSAVCQVQWRDGQCGLVLPSGDCVVSECGDWLQLDAQHTHTHTHVAVRRRGGVLLFLILKLKFVPLSLDWREIHGKAPLVM